jgi:hypothetical protein
MSRNKVQFQKGLSLPEFMEQYGTETQCLKALHDWRWPDGFSCPKCSHAHSNRLKHRNLLQCTKCHNQASVTAGTIFHSTKLSLTKWFLAIHLMTESKNGISQLELGRQVGISINSAALLYHKIAQVMLDRESNQPLSSNIELDDAYWGGKKQGGKRGRGSENKMPFVAALEKTQDNKPHRIKLSVVKAFSKSAIRSWAKDSLSSDCNILSDGLRCFGVLSEMGYSHEIHIVGNSNDSLKTAPFNWVNTILGNLKTALSGTFHKLSKSHLQRHLSTFVYRFNRRYKLQDMLKRFTWVALRTPPMPRKLLTIA